MEGKKKNQRRDRFRESERRVATVMFADISGFTRMSDGMDPEDVTAIMNNCFSMMGRVIGKYGGTIDKFIGDGVMVLFGVPTAIENAPQKALNTAIELRKSVYKFNKEYKLRIPLDIHIGINTGTVLAGTVGSDDKRQYTVIGDTVNIASRLEEVSEAGMILVGPETYRLTKGEFDYREMKPVKLKGKGKTVSLYELLNVRGRAVRGQVDTDRVIKSEMVGRDKELKRLNNSLKNIIDDKGRIVNVIGEAGIGKSRLLDELKSLDVINRVNFLEGQAIAMGRNLPFHPIIDIFKDWAKITEDDNDTVQVEKIAKAVSKAHPSEKDEIVPFMATLMGLKLTKKYADRVRGIEGEALEKLILKNIRELLGKLSEKNPLVICIEDLHWSDVSSIKIIESLMRLVKTNKILFINVFRPNFADTGGRIVETTKRIYPDHYTEINLDPLSERESEALVGNLLSIEGLPYKIREEILKRAGGNPFFIEEVVHSLIDGGAVVRENGKFVVTEKIEEVIIPNTINEVLMARIDGLEEGTKNLVKVASVIGRSFFYKVLTDVIETVGEIGDIEGELSRLLELQMIVEQERMEELEYLFKHALAQEAAYGSILRKKRRELHLIVANSIEKVFTERLHELYGMLAFHYMRGEDEEKSYEYLVKAGEEALKSSASSEALNYYQDALDLYLKKYGVDTDPEKVADLEKNIAVAFYNRGQYPNALVYLDKALSYYGVHTPKNFFTRLIKIMSGLLNFLIGLYIPSLKFKKAPTERDGEIYGLLYKKMSALAVTDPKKMFIESFYRSKRLTDFDITKLENGVGMFAAYSFIITYSGLSFDLSRKILDFCEDKVDRGNLKSVVYYELPRFVHNYMKGDWERIRYDESLVKGGFSIGEIFHAAMYVVFHGHISVDRGELKDARKISERAFKIAVEYENDLIHANGYILQAKLLLSLRSLKEALLKIEEGIVFVNRIESNEYRSLLYSMKARIELLLGEIDGARESLSQAKRYAQEATLIPFYSVHISIARFGYHLDGMEKSLKTGDKKGFAEIKRGALKYGRQAVKNVGKLASERTEAYRLMGLYYWLVGKQARALRWWERSMREGERLGAGLELSRTYFEVGKRLMEEKSGYNELNGITPSEYLERAKGMFVEMGLKYDLTEMRGK